MQASLTDFISCTGATVTVAADPELDRHLLADAVAGSTPDLAIVDGPALLPPLAATGTLAPAPTLVESDLDKLWDPGWRSAGTVNGVTYASPLDVTARGLVWYSPARFADWGYRVPSTWTQLAALVKAAVKAGHGWCTPSDQGAQVRDWLAEVMLRQAGTQTYDAWDTGALPFSDPAVAEALRTVGSMLSLPAKREAGPVPASPAALTAGRCAMVLADQQWGASSTSTSIGPGRDLYAFALPPIAARSGTPLRVDADLVVAFANRPEVQELRYYLSTAQWAGRQYAATGRISANRGLEVNDVADPIQHLVVSLLQQKTAVSRFDAFRLMPATVAVAATSELGSWARGGVSADGALAAIAAAWPHH
jgi:alpha-glucoside transport system substrate-binding protein